jgi:selenocysteine-specific elongation factor
METIVGTAGHIDHGKTALVKALTGIDADRLPEEKRRGITVDLGFAEMTIGDTHFGFVDVPGHEKFVRNMLSGASGIDIVLLVVAADEGVMPQTREHFDICRLLDIKTGVIALTKSDLVDTETLNLARLDVAELVAGSFLENSPIVPVSSRTGDGIDDLKNALRSASERLQERNDNLIARLPIDRSFSIKGFGTVVTGTLVSGEIGQDTRLELLPEQRPMRVRGLQTHGASADVVKAGQRVAVNLANVDQDDVERGMMIAEAGVLEPTQAIDTELEVLADAPRPLRSRARVRVHLGTTELLARLQILNTDGEIAVGAKDFAQVRLELPAVAVPGERFILRSYSPQRTVAGGIVIDNTAERHRRRELSTIRDGLAERLKAVGRPADLVAFLIKASGANGISTRDLRARTGYRTEILTNAKTAIGNAVVSAGDRCIDAAEFRSLTNRALTTMEQAHRDDPLAKGLSREALIEKAFAFLPDEIVTAMIASLEREAKLIVDGETLRLPSHGQTLSPDEKKFTDTFLQIYRDSKLDVPRLSEATAQATEAVNLSPQITTKVIRLLIDAGDIVKVTDEFYFGANVIGDLTDKLKTLAGSEIDVAKFKEIAGVSRKYAIPLLEYFDRTHVTARVGDKRVILK